MLTIDMGGEGMPPNPDPISKHRKELSTGAPFQNKLKKFMCILVSK